MIRPFALAALALAILTAPAAAQFPPPGVYQCVDMDGAGFGVLTLAPDGDYDFATKGDIIGGTGQIASAGNSVNALTGPLADIDLAGSFSTDAKGDVSFMFTTTQGSVLCAVPQR